MPTSTSFENVDGTWRYTEKRMFMRLFGDLSQHLLIEVPRAVSSTAVEARP